jgi:hypothetical protein
MKTLREQWGAETSFTQHLATDIDSLNKINDLVGLPRVLRATNELSILNGSIDVVGYTAKGNVIIYEHQDLSGRADQTHAAKTIRYAKALHVTGNKVLGAILLCESVDQQYLDEFAETRWAYERRPSYNGHSNVHIIKSQWTDEGEYTPALFEDAEIIRRDEKAVDHYKEFHKIYAIDWNIQREERNGDAITLWHRIPELSSKYMAYVHTLKKTIKVGLHCLKEFDSSDEQFLQSICPDGWTYRNTAKDRRTIEREFPLDTDHEVLWAESEKLKQRVRRVASNLD